MFRLGRSLRAAQSTGKAFIVFFSTGPTHDGSALT
jgi:hypothetical protein